MSRWSKTLIAVTVLVGAYAIYLTVQVGPLRDAQRRLAEFCHRTEWHIRNDLKELDSGDLELQQRVMRRLFSGSVTHHDIASVETCLDEVPAYSPECLLGGDVGCRAALARTIADAIKTRYP